MPGRNRRRGRGNRGGRGNNNTDNTSIRGTTDETADIASSDDTGNTSGGANVYDTVERGAITRPAVSDTTRAPRASRVPRLIAPRPIADNDLLRASTTANTARARRAHRLIAPRPIADNDLPLGSPTTNPTPDQSPTAPNPGPLPSPNPPNPRAANALPAEIFTPRDPLRDQIQNFLRDPAAISARLTPQQFTTHIVDVMDELARIRDRRIRQKDQEEDQKLMEQLRGLLAAPGGVPSAAFAPPPSQGVGLNLVAQLQDLEYQPGGIPDMLPPPGTSWPGLDPMFLPGPDGLPPVLPHLPAGPLPDLETQFRALLAETEIANAAEAAGLVEQVVAPTKLVVVCCLATWTGVRETDDTWVAMPGQGTRKGWGMDMANSSERECWRRQIWKGLEVLREVDGEGVLMFSGGPWYEGTKISAAKSYHDFAKSSNFFNYFRLDKYSDLPNRIFTEDRAMDSFQSVVFSLIEFNHRYKNFPEEMTIISYELKRQRFEKLHFPTAKELMLPTAGSDEDVSWQGVPTFIGIDPRELQEYSKYEKRDAMAELEAQKFDLWKGSPFGRSPELMMKKKGRNVWNIDLGYPLVFTGGPELVAALEREAKEGPALEEVVDMSVN